MKCDADVEASNKTKFEASNNTFRQQKRSRTLGSKQKRETCTKISKVPVFPNYVAYEEAKRRWDAENFNASAMERDAAVMQIAFACGV